MKTASDSTGFAWGLLFVALLWLGASAATASAQTPDRISPVLAQTDGSATGESAPSDSQTEPAESAASLPHLKFLFDYILVLGLLAGAILAVCRSCRRV
jgi:hypothetical protein